jgi:nitrite reductase/ring-hydroxylating ferredoxin subunit
VRRRRRLGAFVDALLGHRRPPPFDAAPEDAAAMRAAIELSAAQPGATIPNPDFVSELHSQLADEFGTTRPEDGATVHRLSRRRLLQGVTVAAAAAAVGVVVDRELVGSGGGDAVPAAGTLHPDHGSWQRVAAAADVAPGDVTPFTTATTVGFVVNDGGDLRALSGVCTHQGCLLAHNGVDGRLDCPCHRAAFDLDGNVLFHEFPGTLPALPKVDVRERSGDIEVFVPRPV